MGDGYEPPAPGVRIAVGEDAAPPVVTHAAVAHLALLTRDAEGARRFVERELQPLADAPELRGTALAYLRHECSIGATAHAVGVHRNTVRERLLRAEELLGRRVSAGEIALPLALEGLVGGPGGAAAAPAPLTTARLAWSSRSTAGHPRRRP